MPELPDLTVYQERLSERIVPGPLESVEVLDAFCLRTVRPLPAELAGREVRSVGRIGKRLVLSFEGDLHAVLHLMIAGRLRWRPRERLRTRPKPLVRFTFPEGTLFLTEAGRKRRAALHLVAGQDALRAFDRGGLEPLEASVEDLHAVVRRENRTLKRLLTDPRLIAAVGNAYSDEILFEARLSPMKLTSALDVLEVERLHAAMQGCLRRHVEALRAETAGTFPEVVTAFRETMAVHGRHGRPCRVCGDPIQRIRYAENECNYCATCQVEGRLLRDRALSRLLKRDWPRTLAELEERRRAQGDGP